jgi:hypothetical protein
MAININSLKEEVDDLARKHVTGATFTPDQFNRATQGALRDFVRKYIGLPETYQNGNPRGPIAFQDTSIIGEYINNYKVTDALLMINNSGVAQKPADYFYEVVIKLKKAVNIEQDTLSASMDTCSCGCGDLAGRHPLPATTTETSYVEVPVEVVDDQQYANRLNTQLRKPTKDRPICKIENKRFQFAPFNLGSAYITYIQSTSVGAPKWSPVPLSIPPVYDPLTSVNVNLPDICQTEMSVFVLARLGISVREEFLLAYAQGVKQAGI